MGKFEKADTAYNFPEMEERILRFWEVEDVFGKSLRRPSPNGNFVFFEGPPTANNLPHPGHVLTRVVKDLFPRYKTMRGYYVARKAGWDTHGLPVEIEVEKELGFAGKADIEKYGIAAFNERCLESVQRYEKEWRRISNRIGFWLNYDEAYFTYTNTYIETVWWLLRQMWDQQLIYRGHKIVPYCYRCGTPLSSHEVAQNYIDTKDPSVFIKFRVKDDLAPFSADLVKGKTYFLVWTTTPWTLISNVALAVNPDEEYVAVFHDGEFLILARALLGATGLQEEAVTATFPGSDLAGLNYEPLYDFMPVDKRAHYVISGTFVTMDDGTGIVHIAPAFGEDDYQVGAENNLPFVCAVDERGNFVPEVTKWAGRNVKEADPDITLDLRDRGLLFRITTYLHAYPFCWRCETPLLYYAFPSWFIRTTAVREQLLANNEKINWVPEHIRAGRFGQWLEGVVDWALSRNRYWGTPLPIWECGTCGISHCVGSFSELQKLVGFKVKDLYDQSQFNPHRPFVDEMTWKCACGGTMRRVPHVIDCWFDSGSMPFSQHHYPFEHKDDIDSGAQFPADFISEAIDQTRGWFYTLHAIATIIKDSPAYKTCLVLGHIQDEKGHKMSKSQGNYADPWNVINRQGADAFRWFFFSSNAPWINTRYTEAAVISSLQKFLIPLWNVYSFFTIYANIDDYDPAQPALPWRDRPLLDRWILIKYNHLVKTVTENLDNYRVTEAARSIEGFLDILSNWHVRRSRRRFWQSEKNDEKWCAYHTLYGILCGLAKLIAPFTPFISEELYQKLVRPLGSSTPESVHLCDYPETDETVVDTELEDGMDSVLRVVKLGHAARNQSKIKVRQPLREIILVSNDPMIAPAIKPYHSTVCEELNVKGIRWAELEEEYVNYQLKPNFAVLGPRLGKAVSAVQKALASANASQLVMQLSESGSVKLTAGGEEYDLTADDLDIRIIEREGTVAQRDGNLLLVLDLEITPALREEGLSREFINRVQTLRKNLSLDYEQRIRLKYAVDEPVRAAVGAYADTIKHETLATELTPEEGLADDLPNVFPAEIEGLEVLIQLVPVKAE
jgi:isoleucyl-tRNA synthetase